MAAAAVGAGAASGSESPVAGAPTSTPEPIALDCAPPLLCTSAPRGSSVTVDPIDVAAVVPVVGVDAGAEVDAPTEEPLDERVPVDEGVPVDGVLPVDRVLPVDGVLPPVDGVPLDGVPVDEAVPGVAPAGGVVDESVADEPESVGFAHATPGEAARAIPTPNAAANPPTRPMYLALLMIFPSRATDVEL